MKTLLTLSLLFATLFVAAQVPQGLNYQAIYRDAQGMPKANENVTVLFSILDGSANGPAVYVENHTVQTNQFGLFNLTIGQGNVVSGSFANIGWGNGGKFLKVEVNNSLLGTTQLWSVPYALYAEKSNIQAGTGISIAGSVIANTGDLSDTNELQQLQLNGITLTLSNGGGSVTLPAGSTYTAGNGIAISGTTITNMGDLSNTNELQNLSISGSTLSITGGNSVTLPSGGSSQWTTTGNDIYYKTGKVLIGTNTAIHPYAGSVLQVVSDANEAEIHLYGVNGGSNYNNITIRDLTTQSGWSIAHKAVGNLNHQLMFEYLDGITNTQNYNTFKITPSGKSGFGMDYSDVPPSRVSVKGGDVNILDIGSGVIMKSPNGSCWRLTVSNSGQPVFTSITCPQ